MNPKKITSLQNPLVKYVVKLKNDRAFRAQERQALVIGEKILFELLPFVEVKCFFVTESQDFSPKLDLDLKHEVSREVFQKITGLANDSGIAALITIPPPSELEGKNFILVIDELSDPGNLGTILRTAKAFGWEGIFILNNSVDLFNDKTIRASRGASFLLPYATGTLEDLMRLKTKAQAPLYVADLQGTDLKEISPGKSTFLVLSNEGKGVSKMVKREGIAIHIPMPGNMESLNVAIAAGILMYKLKS
jgi:TrmH family RNA methyltransferase